MNAYKHKHWIRAKEVKKKTCAKKCIRDIRTHADMANYVHKESEKSPQMAKYAVHICTHRQRKCKWMKNDSKRNGRKRSRVHSHMLKAQVHTDIQINGNKWCSRLFIDTCYNVFYFNVLVVLYSACNSRVYVGYKIQLKNIYIAKKCARQQPANRTNWKYFWEFSDELAQIIFEWSRLWWAHIVHTSTHTEWWRNGNGNENDKQTPTESRIANKRAHHT